MIKLDIDNRLLILKKTSFSSEEGSFLFFVILFIQY